MSQFHQIRIYSKLHMCLAIDFKQYLNMSADYAILNTGTPFMGGTHWVAVSNKDHMYFDPLCLPVRW